MDRVRVLMVDDNIPFRSTLKEALAREESIEVVGEASDGEEGVEKARELKPHVILMDLYMPRCTGLEATRRVQRQMPETKVLMCTVSDKDADLVNCLKAGASGYVLKNEMTELMVHAIHYVSRGGILVSPSMAPKLLREVKPREPAEERVQVQPPPRTEETPGQAAGAMAGQPTAGPAEPSQERAESPASVPEAAPDALAKVANLVIPPPLEPRIVLRLHQWLREVAKGEVEKVSGSWGGATTIKVSFRQPVPLVRMLAGLPYLAEVVEEPVAPEKGMSPEGALAQAKQKAGALGPPSRHLRLVLKPE